MIRCATSRNTLLWIVAAIVLVYGQELLLRHNEKANRMDVFKKVDSGHIQDSFQKRMT